MLGKKNDGRHGGAESSIGRPKRRSSDKVPDASAALGDPVLTSTEIEPDPDAATTSTVMSRWWCSTATRKNRLSYLNSRAGQEPRPALFALLQERSPGLMKRVLRAGADELLFLPLDTGDATRALLKISETRRREEFTSEGHDRFAGQPGRRQSASPALPANLALALRYALDKRVAVIDLDLQTGALSVFLNVEPERTIMALTEGTRKLDSIQLEAALSKHASGIYLLAAPKRIEDSEMVTDGTVGRRDRDHAPAVRLRDRRLRHAYRCEHGRGMGALATSVLRARPVDRRGAMRVAIRRSVRTAGAAGDLEPAFVISRFVAQSSDQRRAAEPYAGQGRFTRRIPRDEKVLERVQLSAQDLWQVAPNSPLTKSVEEMARRLEVVSEIPTAIPRMARSFRAC